MANSIGTMIIRISGLHGTKDVTEWENDFIRSIVEKYNARDKSKAMELTQKQVEIIERIHDKHFA
jgi:hypothetical protein